MIIDDMRLFTSIRDELCTRVCKLSAVILSTIGVYSLCQIWFPLNFVFKYTTNLYIIIKSPTMVTNANTLSNSHLFCLKYEFVVAELSP